MDYSRKYFQTLLALMLWILFTSTNLAVGQETTSTSTPDDLIKSCTDQVSVHMCQLLMGSIPNFCTLPEHRSYAMGNCPKSCELCQLRLTHGTNLIWAQSPMVRYYKVSRLVAIKGDPNEWVGSRDTTVTYLNAPRFTWEFTSLTFSWRQQLLFWSESAHKKIQSLSLNGSGESVTIFSGTSPEVNGIAYDWLNRNLYFADALYNWILLKSIKSDSTSYKIVVNEGLDLPQGLALYPQKGLLFFADAGARPKIEVTDLLGNDRRMVADDDMLFPRDLCIDYKDDVIFWVDAKKGTVEKMGLDGSGRTVLIKEEGAQYYGLAIYDDYLFVTDKSHKGVLKVIENKDVLVSFNLNNSPFDILMYDESRQPGNSSECDSAQCEQMCVEEPSAGPQCLCGEGYNLNEDNVTCKQTDRFVHPSHIYTMGDSICRYPANLADMSLVEVTLDSQCFVEERKGYMTLTFDARTNMLYYFANKTKTISRIPLEPGGRAKGLTGGTGVVNGMSFDWTSGNLFWTDATQGVIKVGALDCSYQSVVLEDLNNPFGIAVHPGRGKIYWTDHGHLPDIGAKVEMANMDGSDLKVIMGDNLGQPSHIYIDFKKDKLYWSDSLLHHVRMLDLDTQRITVVYEQDDVKFLGLSLFQDYLLWTDTEQLNGIHAARMDTKEKVRGIIHPKAGYSSDLITFDIQNQPDFNTSCSPDVNQCSQICLQSIDGAPLCACGTGYELSEDGNTCTTSPVLDNFLLVNDAFQRQIFQINVQNGAVRAVNVKQFHEPVALTYDPLDYKVFWSDNEAKVIKEATLSGRYEKMVLLMSNDSMCDGLVADYINKLLFYTDAGRNVIGVISLRNYSLQYHVIHEDLDEPRAIVASPNVGRIFWTDWGTKARIETSYMDGSQRETLVKFDVIAWPNGLALDNFANKLYWVDAYSTQISTMDLVTRDIRVLVTKPDTHFFSIYVMGEFLYVTDWKRNYLTRMNKTGGPLRRYGETLFTRLYGATGYNSSEGFRGISVCASSVCEHLCLPSGHHRYQCQCSLGFVLKNENECVPAPMTTTGTPGTIMPPTATTTTTTPKEVETTTHPQTTMKKSTWMRTTNILATTPTTRTPTISATLKSSPTSSSSSSASSSTQSSSSSTPATSTTRRTTAATTTTTNNIASTSTTPVVILPATRTSATSKYSLVTETMVPVTGKETSHGGFMNNTTPKAQATQHKSGDSTFLTAPVIIAIAISCAVIIVIVIVVVAFMAKRNRQKVFMHNKLVESRSPSVDLTNISYSKNDHDSITIDLGIENPTYDYLHDNGASS